MASSNIKLFDENKGNMLSDSEFSISNQRMNGLQTGVASSQLQNKAMYQASLVAYAIAQVMMQNGLNANDTDAVSAFVANLSNTMLQKVYDAATTAEAQAGVATGKWMSPALVKAAIDTLAAKAQNILSDETKALYGLGSNNVPNDVFVKIAQQLQNKADTSSVYSKDESISASTRTALSLPETATPDAALAEIARKLSDITVELNVLTSSGTTVKAVKGSTTLTATAGSDGWAKLHPSEFGEWKVTAGGTSKTINIDAIAVFYLVMSDLESLSWSDVASISKMGLASTLFHIGDKKTLTVNGVSYNAVIIGFDHDTPVDTATYGRDKAGITWQLENCLATTYRFNRSDTNRGGWATSEMRTSTMETLLNQLASDLKASIVKVQKKSANGYPSTAIDTTEDNLFLLSEIEVFGYLTYSYEGEGNQYEYYKAGNTVLKRINGTVDSWWERSPYNLNNAAFCGVTTIGKPGNIENGGASVPHGVSFAFCV